MKSSTKSTLTGGTISLIVIIVAIFGNLTARKLENQLSNAHKAVIENGKAIQKLNRQIELLRKENEKLKNHALPIE